MKKVCNACNTSKSLSEFWEYKKSKDGLNWWCIVCAVEHKNNYDLNNIEKVRKSRKKYKQSKKGKATEERFVENNPNYRTEYNREYWKTPQNSMYRAEYRKENRYKARWRDILKNALDQLGQKKEGTTRELLRYSPLDLQEHLNSFGYDPKTQDIDHKIPVSWFIDTAPTHIVNNLKNIHPLNTLDNKKKLNLYSHPVEESYYKEALPYIKEKYYERVTRCAS